MRTDDVIDNETSPPRRAPTTSTEPAPPLWQQVPRSLYATGTVSFLLLVGGIGVGISDAGMIDVQEASDRQQQVTAEEASSETHTVPVQTSETRNVPRLRPAASPRPAAGTAPATDEVATTTATSTEPSSESETATSSAATNEDADVEEAEEVTDIDEQDGTVSDDSEPEPDSETDEGSADD